MATETTDQRIDRLEREIAALKAETSAPRPAAPRVQEEGVIISYPNTYPIPMPTREEYEKLLSIVERAGVVPKFDREMDRQEFFRGFVASFERIANLRRLDGLDLKRQAHDWAIEAQYWLSERGTPATTTDGSFFAACVAAGDVPYSFAKSALGIPARLGLTHDSDARRALPAWRDEVLERGRPRAPLPALSR
jgi:hypothetical protein